MTPTEISNIRNKFKNDNPFLNRLNTTLTDPKAKGITEKTREKEK